MEQDAVKPFGEAKQPDKNLGDDLGSDAMLKTHLELLVRVPEKDELHEIVSAPLFTKPVLDHADNLSHDPSKAPFSQHALLAGDSSDLQKTPSKDPRVFYNVATPSSVFICGSQGSGKSHTLSCLLENCLIPSSRLGRLPKPLTGIVFHYDTFLSDTGGTPCEAAYLASDPRVNVRVLCAPTNIQVIKDIYSKVGNVTVEELRLDESDLNTKRMLDLMAFGDKGQQPLYMSVIQRILRDMRIEQQTTRSRFKYALFANKLDKEPLTPDQRRPLNQRLDTLESFLVQARPSWEPRTSRKALVGTDWRPQPGELLIVDLSCPCVTAAMACSLFNICLSVFLEQQNVSSQTQIGRIIALDEAYKYMGETAECESLTNNLLSTIRLQRHLGARIFISTQEPTISPKLLDLCSVTVVHCFTSPDWLRVLSDHLAGISSAAKIARMLEGMEQQQQQEKKDSDLLGNGSNEQDTSSGIRGIALSSETPVLELFSRIVKLGTGEALVFSPSSIVGLEKDVGQGGIRTHRRLAHGVLQVVVRARITEDGGLSIMAA